MPNVIAVPCDVPDPDQVLAAASTVGGHTGGTLDLLINNAGYSPHEGVIEAASMTEYRRAFEVNFWGPVQVVQAMTPLLRASKGRIINTTSGSVYVNIPMYSAYPTSKSALKTFTRHLRMELAPFGIEVTSLEPGGVETAMAEGPEVEARHWVLRSQSRCGSSTVGISCLRPPRSQAISHSSSPMSLPMPYVAEGHPREAPETFVSDSGLGRGLGSAVVAPPAPSPAGREHLAPHVQQEARWVAELGPRSAARSKVWSHRVGVSRQCFHRWPLVHVLPWLSRAGGSGSRVTTTTTFSWDVAPVDKPDDFNVVIGQAHFIKTVEDLHEAIVGVSSSLRFGLAFCEASGPRLVAAPAMILNSSSSRPVMRWPSPPGTAS